MRGEQRDRFVPGHLGTAPPQLVDGVVMVEHALTDPGSGGQPHGAGAAVDPDSLGTETVQGQFETERFTHPFLPVAVHPGVAQVGGEGEHGQLRRGEEASRQRPPSAPLLAVQEGRHPGRALGRIKGDEGHREGVKQVGADPSAPTARIPVEPAGADTLAEQFRFLRG